MFANNNGKCNIVGVGEIGNVFLKHLIILLVDGLEHNFIFSSPTCDRDMYIPF